MCIFLVDNRPTGAAMCVYGEGIGPADRGISKMANFKYFTDLADGSTVELTGVWHQGVSTKKPSNFHGFGPNGEKLDATRVIERKPFPSRHECDARCLNANGRTMKCECSCNGKNHGKGSSLIAA